MELKIKNAIEKVRPSLQGHGGDVRFVEVSADGVVKVELQGACGGCAGAKMTLKMIVEKILKEEVPEIKEVVGV